MNLELLRRITRVAEEAETRGIKAITVHRWPSQDGRPAGMHIKLNGFDVASVSGDLCGLNEVNLSHAEEIVNNAIRVSVLRELEYYFELRNLGVIAEDLLARIHTALALKP